jgi:hypothetical protein
VGKIKRYGRHEYPVRHRNLELLEETNTMPSRRVAADLNAGTYYLTLTSSAGITLFDRHNRWHILVEYCVTARKTKDWN